MAWSTEMVSLLRYVINDTDTLTQEYSDARLQSLIITAAQLTLGVVDFPRTYIIDIANTTMSPDPTSGTRDNGFVNLVILKAACLLATGDYRSSTNKGVVIRDGPSSIDARGMLASKKDIMDSACTKYDAAELEFRLGNSNAGEAIIGPHRNAVHGGSTSDRGGY